MSMGLIGMGFLIGVIVTITIISFMMISKHEEKPQEKGGKDI